MQDNREITNEEVQKASEIINNLLSYYNSKVVGQPYLGYSLLVAMMTNGHVLLESVPGLAKTTAARVMTEAIIFKDPVYTGSYTERHNWNPDVQHGDQYI